jgi:hypothetical protein
MKTPLSITSPVPNQLQKICLVTIVILSAIVLPLPATAQANPPPSKSSSKIRWKPPIPPSSLGIPGNRAQGGGTRGCQPYQGIAALVPMSPQQVAWGQTIGNRPTVWLNVPQGLAKDLPIEITVREQNGQPIAKQSLKIDRTISAGAIGIPFPSATVLKLDRLYRWEVAFYCDAQDRVDRPSIVQGQIQRIATPIQLTPAKSPLEMAQTLAERGIWYDAIAQLGNRLGKTKDRELVTAWSELLHAAGIRGSDLIRDWNALDPKP